MPLAQSLTIPNPPQPRRSRLRSRTVTIIALVVFFPLGVVLMWMSGHFPKIVRWGITAAAVLLTISLFSGKGGGYPVGDDSISTDQYWVSISRLNELTDAAQHELNRASWDVAAAQNGRVSFRDLTAAINGLSLAGMSGKERLLEYGPSAAMLAKISGRSVDKIGKDLFLLNRRQQFTKDEAVSTMLTIFNISERQPITATPAGKRVCFEALVDTMHLHADAAVPWIQSLDHEERRSLLQHLALVQAAISKAIGTDESGAKFSTLLARAVATDAESFDKIGRATGFALGDATHLQALILTEAGTQKILDSLAAVAGKLSK